MASLLTGCADEHVGERTHRLAQSGDASGDGANDVHQLEGGADQNADLTSCGKVPEQGCCNGQVLYFCKGGTLKSIDCSSKPKCGWSNSGFHDCNTSGAPDPTGTFALYCWGLLPDGGVFDGSADAGGECGEIGIEGCCDGTTLRYCQEGQLKSVSCGLNPTCGWFAMGQYYDCGTQGASDPTGTYPRVCPNSKAGDGIPDLFPWSEAGSDLSVDGGGGGGSGDGCGCALATPARPSAPGLLLLTLIALLAIRRRG
jgi:MYXO-CTERM domain-containing protein